MSKTEVYSVVPDEETNTPTKETLVQESRWSTKKRILIALATMMFIGGMMAIIIDDECGHHDHHHDHHPHYHHHHHSKRNGVRGYYLWVPDENTVVDKDEDDAYCNEHEWCRNAKAWYKEHVDSEESMTDTDSSNSDSGDSSDFVAYFKNSKPEDEDEALEVEELPSLTQNVQEKTEGLLRGGKVTDGGN